MTWTSGVACRAKDGQSTSGDAYLIHDSGEGLLIIAVIDGLGSGEDAARAAHCAAQIIGAHHDQPLATIIRQAHTALHNTRGAVIGMFRLDQLNCTARFIGVGNIGAYVYSRRSIKPISKNGILGFRLPTLLELPYMYDPGDVFILYSDGISGRFSQDTHIDVRKPPQLVADHILTTYGKTTDDATVVLVKT